jgi:superfamily II DNA/RNA helicase
MTQHQEKPTLIFCNTMASACKLHRQVSENETIVETLKTVPSLLHGSIPERQRQAIMQRFQNGYINFLICTDLASRGLDTTHVSSNRATNYININGRWDT